MNNSVKIVFQEPDGLYPVEGKMLSKSELEKLIALMDGTRWIIINWADPPRLSYSPDSFDAEKLSDNTLQKLVDGEPLSDTDRLNIKAAAIN